ncbi:MAG: hypothetical protein BRD49_03900, partial [Bacteroidetes bacterium SW_10_40_5]
GEKDTTPPKLITANPPLFTKNFDQKEINLEFDEFFTLNQPQQNVIISPPLKYQAEYKVRGKKLKIHIDEPLKNNTTYTINFGTTIKDYHEGNAKKGFKYVFSTGSYIDSLSVKGKIVNGRDLKPSSGVKVLLHNDLHDSAIYQERPFYYGLTDDEGTFELDYLKKDNYRLYVLDDLNDDYRKDEGERFGYLNEHLKLKKDTTLKDIAVYQEEPIEPEVIKSEELIPGKIRVEFNKPVDTFYYNFNWGSGIKKKSWQFSEFLAPTKDSALIWHDYIKADSIKSTIFNDNFSQTLKFYRGPADTLSQQPFKIGSNFSDGSYIPGEKLQLRFPTPIASFNPGQIMLLKDSVEINRGFDFKLTSPAKRNLQINNQLKQDSSYRIKVEESAFQDMYGRLNQTFEQTFHVENQNNYGVLSLNINKTNVKAPVVIYLHNDQDELVRKKYTVNSRKLKFNWLKPKKYYVRAVVDKNKNKLWDPGNFSLKTLPEPVVKYPEAIEIRAKWELLDLEFEIKEK